jgi:hypothetical protein
MLDDVIDLLPAAKLHDLARIRRTARKLLEYVCDGVSVDTEVAVMAE